jgi:hypothetical protein
MTQSRDPPAAPWQDVRIKPGQLTSRQLTRTRDCHSDRRDQKPSARPRLPLHGRLSRALEPTLRSRLIMMGNILQTLQRKSSSKWQDQHNEHTPSSHMHIICPTLIQPSNPGDRDSYYAGLLLQLWPIDPSPPAASLQVGCPSS